MLAFVLTGYGGPDRTRLEQHSPPMPGPTQLLVRVRAAGLNPVDFKTREGKLKLVQKLKLPAIMGNELSGEVIAAGSGVTKFKNGDRIYARLGKGTQGAFAEQALVEESDAALMPTSLDFSTAAAVPLAALTALQALRDELGVKEGDRIFISGGAGGVGTFAIQLAKVLGATVTTSASARGDALVRSLGADEVIDYTKRPIASIAAKFDGAFDLIGGETLDQLFGVVKRGGCVVSVAGVPEPQTATKDLGGSWALATAFWLVSLGVRAKARRAGVSYRFLFMHPSGEDLTTIAELIDQGRLKVVVDRAVPFEQIADAMAYLESGRAKGKVVVTMS